MNVDFNSKVKAGQLLAVVDPRLYKANMAHEEAAMAKGHRCPDCGTFTLQRISENWRQCTTCGLKKRV